MKIVLLTGGAGYIGSHTYLELIKAKYQPIIIDNFSNSYISTIKKLEILTKQKVVFIKGDVTDYKFLEKIFKKFTIKGIIHFAALKSIPESFLKPKLFHRNNVISTDNLLKLSIKYGCNYFIFSSSAAVYKNSNTLPFTENSITGSINPYAKTKLTSEKKIIDYSQKHKRLKFVILRYFNPVGSDPSGLIGEFPKKQMGNLMPEICKVALRKKKSLKIFGDDYNTIDGSCIRDFIHVSDLARGHVSALRYIEKRGINGIFNLGTGKGTSVFDIVKSFEKINKIKIPLSIHSKRKGDMPTSFANASLANKKLNWKPQKDISEMCKSSWISYKKLHR